MSKTCNVCKETKPLEEFYKHPSSYLGVRPDCKVCRLAYHHKKYIENPRKYIQAQNRMRLKRSYNLTPEALEDLKRKQNNICTICLSACNLQVDHCHKTLRVRGLLCPTCNKALGLLKDDIKIFERAIKYLKDINEE